MVGWGSRYTLPKTNSSHLAGARNPKERIVFQSINFQVRKCWFREGYMESPQKMMVLNMISFSIWWFSASILIFRGVFDSLDLVGSIDGDPNEWACEIMPIYTIIDSDFHPPFSYKITNQGLEHCTIAEDDTIFATFRGCKDMTLETKVASKSQLDRNLLGDCEALHYNLPNH